MFTAWYVPAFTGVTIGLSVVGSVCPSRARHPSSRPDWCPTQSVKFPLVVAAGVVSEVEADK